MKSSPHEKIARRLEAYWRQNARPGEETHHKARSAFVKWHRDLDTVNVVDISLCCGTFTIADREQYAQ